MQRVITMDAPSIRRVAGTTSLSMAALFVALAICGGVRGYSPVPYWDSWDGYLNFFMQVTDGNVSAWWSRHNEHPIVLSRILFYIDLAWLGGTGILPTIATYVMTAVGAWLLCAAISDVAPGRSSASRLPVIGVIVGLMFFWCQSDNFTSSFQNQFPFALVLPLASLYAAAHSIATLSSPKMFFVACVLGVIALGSMANGVLALPILFVYALTMGMSRRRLTVLLLLSLVAIASTRIGQGMTPTTSPMSQVLLTRPLDTLHFVLLYLGSPLWYALPHTTPVYVATMAAGLFVIVASAGILLVTWRRRHAEPVRMALIAFLGYLGATALGTALGRLELGVDGALSGRYTSVGVIAWCALIVACLPRQSMKGNWSRWAPVAPAVFLLILLPCQLRATRSQHTMQYTRDLAALALTLKVPDDDAIHAVYPVTSRALQIAGQARDRGLSVFGAPPYTTAIDVLGKPAPPADAARCRGGISARRGAFEGNPFQRIDGWLDSPLTRTGDPVLIIDSHDTIVGFAVATPRRSLKPKVVGPGVAVFTGYARVDATHSTDPSNLSACALSDNARSTAPE